MHPLTLLVLPHLFRRFGQNERSLFSFLSGDDPFGFQEFLRNNSMGGTEIPYVRVDYLYDYVMATMGSTVYSHVTGKLWSEAEEALFRLHDRDPLQARLIKAIGLLHILGEQTKVLPSREVLEFALTSRTVGPQDIETAISSLDRATLITYRQFKRAYRLYEGSDVDVDARLRDARTHYASGADAITTASRLGITPPIVARRHSYETGTLRFFDVRYCRARELEKEITTGPRQGDGLLLLCLASDEQELTAVEAALGATLPAHPHVIVGVNTETDALHEAAVAVEALLWVREETPELRNDRVASREVRERLLEAQTAFRAEWERLLRPQGDPEGGAWHYQGQRIPLRSYRQLQELISRACDEAYPRTPRLLNELINRRQLSSASAAARRNLIEAMIEKRVLPRLDLRGFPPEVSMYVSLLEATGIHRVGPDGTWGLYPPGEKKDFALSLVWREIEDFLFSEAPADKTLTVLNRRLKSQPYGLTDGIIPVILCAALLHNEAEVAVYEEGRFVTNLDAATFERMTKRPEDYRLQGCRVSGERQAVLERFARGVLRPGEAATVVSVVRRLYRQFERLPKYAWRTRRLSPTAIALRSLFEHGREPEQLLFVDLPGALETRPFVAQETDRDNAAQFFDRWNDAVAAVLGAYEELLVRIQAELERSFGVDYWEDIRGRAAALVRVASEPRLKAFSARAADAGLSRLQWLESVAAGLLGYPPSAWGDEDEQRFLTLLSPLVSAFHNAELVAFEKQKMGGEDQRGLRLAVTLDTGAEDARVVLVPKAAASRVERLTAAVLREIEQLLKNEPHDVRVAVLGQVVQAMIGGKRE